MAVRKSKLFGRLRRAIQKVKFLLSFSSRRWLLLSSLMGSSPGPRHLSCKAQPGLLGCTAGASEDYYHEVGSSFGISRTTSSTSGVLSRTTSSASEISRTISNASTGDDIDKRAEIFIANFYRHIQMERQVSLELRYCKERSLERTSSD